MGASPRLLQRYRQVTGLIARMKVGDLDRGGVGMGELADTSEALSDNFARAVFDLVLDNKAQAATAATTAAVQQSNALLAQVVDRLDQLEAVTTQAVRASGSSTLRASLNR